MAKIRRGRNCRSRGSSLTSDGPAKSPCGDSSGLGDLDLRHTPPSLSEGEPLPLTDRSTTLTRDWLVGSEDVSDLRFTLLSHACLYGDSGAGRGAFLRGAAPPSSTLFYLPPVLLRRYPSSRSWGCRRSWAWNYWLRTTGNLR